MITLAVVAIVAVVALPSFDYLLASNKHSSSTNKLIGAINLARLEAVKRGKQVAIKTLDNSNSWSKGYLIWVDTDEDGVFDSGEELIRRFDLVENAGLALSGTVNRFVFRATGFATAAGSVNVCSNVDAVAGRAVTVFLSGRVTKMDYTCP